MDMWTMTKKEPEQHGKAWLASKIEPFLVKTVSVDDIIDNKVKPTVDYSEGEGKKVDKMFLVKIDTQGYEPEVLKGMKKSISEHKIDFIITEYWPKGMDFMHGVKNEERCEKPAQMLKFLLDSGYILFAMPIVGHPKAPKAAINEIVGSSDGKNCLPIMTAKKPYTAKSYHSSMFPINPAAITLVLLFKLCFDSFIID